MREWTDPADPKSSRLMLYLEFWAISAIMLLGFAMAFGPPILHFLRGVM